MYVLCVCTGFHTQNFNGSLVSAIKLKVEKDVPSAAMLLFYILKECYCSSSCILFHDLLF